MKSVSNQLNEFTDMYRWLLVGNLRLWSVQELVSSISVYGLQKHTRRSSNYKS